MVVGSISTNNVALCMDSGGPLEISTSSVSQDALCDELGRNILLDQSKARSAGGPVEVFDIPDSPGGPVEVPEEESSQVGPSVDLSSPFSSSPAPKEPEAWRTWKIKEFPDQTSRQGPPETSTVFLKVRGAGKEGEPYHYNPQEVRYDGACKSLSETLLG